MKQDARSTHLYKPVQGTLKDTVLPTNATARRHPTHRWYNFIAGYSPEFVYSCMINARLKPDDKILDPFAGCGTTLVTAQMAGFDSVGYEPHPFFYNIAWAKTSDPPTLSHIDKIHDVIVSGLSVIPPRNVMSDDAWTFLNKLFEPAVLSSLLGARIGLERANLNSDPLAFLILSRLIDECSFAQTDGIYKAPTSRKRATPPLQGISNLIDTIKADVVRTPYTRMADAIVINSTSEHMTNVADGSIGLIVTSPPYLNNFDYAEMTRMHLYFWNMAKSWSDITEKVRSRLIVNTTTALKGQREKQTLYADTLPSSVRAEINAAAEQLAIIKKQKLGKKDYDLLLFPYMAQIQAVYSECYRVLRSGGRAHTMISDAAFYGIHIPSPQWLAHVLGCIGFRSVECTLVRTRGQRWVLDKRLGSPVGLGEYHIMALK